MINLKTPGIFLLTLATPSMTLAATQTGHEPMDLTACALGFTAIIIFVFTYLPVASAARCYR